MTDLGIRVKKRYQVIYRWMESSFSLSDKGKIGRYGQGTRMNSVMIQRLGI